MHTFIKLSSLFYLLIPFVNYGQSLENEPQQLLDSIYETNTGALGVLIHVEFLDYYVSRTATVDFSDNRRQTIRGPHQPVLIASNTKTYNSAAILKLIKKKK